MKNKISPKTPTENRMHQLIRLFLDFMKIGSFTFGSGWAIIAQLNKLYVEERKDTKSEELLDITSVGRSLPGTMTTNVAMLFGYQKQGFLGGLMCVFGIVIPPMIILTVITYFYSTFQTNPWVLSAMTGIRSAIVPIMISAMVSMVKGAFKVPICYAVTVLTVMLYLFFDISCVLLVVMGIVCGLIISRFFIRKS